MKFELAIPLNPRRPACLREAGDRLCKVLEHTPLRFLALHGAQLLPHWERRRMTPRRPARREAIGLVARAMLEHADVASYRVGSPRGDGYVTPPGQEGDGSGENGLCYETGLTVTRLRRAIATMVQIEWLEGPRKDPDGKMQPKHRQPVTQYDHKPSGEKRYCAHRVVYRFTDKFFAAVGMTKRMEREKRKAHARREDRRQRLYAGALLAGRELTRGMRAGSRETRHHDVPGAPTPAVAGRVSVDAAQLNIDQAENAARLVQTLKVRLRERHPDWGAARLEAEAQAIARATRPR